MAERSVVVRIRAEHSAFRRDMAQVASAATRAARSTEDAGRRASTVFGRLAQDARRNSDAWEKTGNVFMGVGTALVAGVGLAISRYAAFEKAMSKVQAATHASASDMSQFREAAIKAGSDTAYSAEEAAGAIEELSKAGVQAQDILHGGLDGALNLAAAGQLDVAKSAEIAATALTQFKLGGEDIPHLADLLSAGAGKAQGSVEDLGMALNQSGLVASATGLSIEETTGTLAAFASAGLVGSDAGTSFKSMLQMLQNPSKQSQKQLDALGISMYDANGEFVGMTDLAGQLQAGMKDLTQAERDKAMATIFGSDAVRAANVLYADGAKGIQKWIGAVDDAGYAAITAGINQDNLAGDIEKLGGAIDTALISGGEGPALVLRGIVQGAEGVVDAFGRIPAPALSAATGVAGVVGAAALGTGAFLKFVPAVIESVGAFRNLGTAGSRIPGMLGTITKRATIAGLAIAGIAIAGRLITEKQVTSYSDVADALLKVGNAGKEAKAADLDSLFTNWDKMLGGEGGLKDINGMADAIQRITHPESGDGINRWADGFADFFGVAKSETSQIDDRLKSVGDELGNLVDNGGAPAAAKAFSLLADEFERNGSNAQDALDHMPAYKQALQDQAHALGQNVEGQDLLNWALTGTAPAAVAAADAANVAAGGVSAIGDAAADAVPSLDDVISALFQMGVLHMDSREATAAFNGAMRDAKDTVADLANEEAELNAKGETLGAILKKNGKDFDLNTEAGARANEAFQNVARSGMAEFEAKAKEGAGTKELRSSLKGTYDGLITTLGGFGITGKGAETLARQVLGVPDGVSISSWMSTAAKQVAENTKGAIDAIPKNVDVTINTWKNTYETTLRKTIEDPSGMGSSTGGRKNGSLRGGLARGGRLPGLDVGGRLPATGLGTDKILGVNSDGVPLAWVDDHEWVVNRRSSDKYNRVLGLINRDDPSVRGLAAFASGGRLGWSKRDEAAQYRQYRALKDAKADDKKVDAAKAEWEAAKERTKRLRDSERDLKTDLRRGDIRDSVMSGNGLSVVDRLFEASRNGDLSKYQRGKLGDAARSAEKKIMSMQKQAESLEKQLDKATAARDKLFQAKEGVRSAVNGTFDLGDLLGQKNAYGYDVAVSKSSLLTYGKQKAAGAKKLAGIMAKLRKLWFRPEILQEVVNEWTAKGTFELADALLTMSQSERRTMNNTYKYTDKYADQAGYRLTEAMKKGGLHAADGLIAGLEDKQDDLNKAMWKVAKGMEKTLRKAWGIHSPSKLMQQLMHHVGDGGVIGLEDKQPEMEAAMASMVPVPQASFTGWGVPTGTVRHQVNAPVMELSAADRQIMSEFIAASRNMPPMVLQVDRRQAGTIVQAGQQAMSGSRSIK